MPYLYSVCPYLIPGIRQSRLVDIPFRATHTEHGGLDLYRYLGVARQFIAAYPCVKRE